MSFNKANFNDALLKAAESFNRERAAELCQELVQHLRERDNAYPTDDAKVVLGQLRGQRWFGLMQEIADALIQNGQRAPYVRRQYAQSQLDQGNLTAAISILEDLETDTAPGGKNQDVEEYAEARGLMGRAYKDLYVLSDNPNRSKNRRALQRAIDYYKSIYHDDKSKIWQGINCVALIRRADTDGVELDDIAGLKTMADAMATEVLAEVKKRHLAKQADTWDFATGLEACIGLGLNEDALTWLQRYLRSQYTSAFELGSTYRQLTQVWKLQAKEAPGDRILPALKGPLLQQKGSEIEIKVSEVASENLDALAQDSGYEKVLGTEGFKSFKWFRKCMQRAAAVAMIEDTNEQAVGTAFVIRGGDLKPELGDELLLLTNAHVISKESKDSRVLRPDKAILKFELWEDGASPAFKIKELWSSPPDMLDATLMRPTPALENVVPMPVTKILPPAGEEQRAYIIGHPQGRKLSFSIHDNYLLDYDSRLLHYRSPTEPGSSGSPVFNDDWELIGLHHRGLRKMPRLNGKEGTYPANEGIWIKAIIEKIENVSFGD